MITQEPEYYTIQEAAELLRVSAPTIRRWIRAGTLRADRIGSRTIRVRAAEVRRAGTGQPVATKAKSPLEGLAPAVGRLDGRKFPQFLSDNPMPLSEWLKRSEKDLAEQLRKRGGVPFPSSVDAINEAREAMDERW